LAKRDGEALRRFSKRHGATLALPNRRANRMAGQFVRQSTGCRNKSQGFQGFAQHPIKLRCVAQ
jgi:hypothetical protein